jgi:hypothetical protein
LVACNRGEIFNTSDFYFASDLIVNPELDGLVTTTVEFESDILVETIENNSSFDIELGFPEIQYFDGENWRIVPMNEEFEFPAISETISSNTFGSPELTRAHLEYYMLPNEGQFLLVRRIYIETSSAQNRDFHDLVIEFSLDR